MKREMSKENFLCNESHKFTFAPKKAGGKAKEKMSQSDC